MQRAQLEQLLWTHTKKNTRARDKEKNETHQQHVAGPLTFAH